VCSDLVTTHRDRTRLGAPPGVWRRARRARRDLGAADSPAREVGYRHRVNTRDDYRSAPAAPTASRSATWLSNMLRPAADQRAIFEECRTNLRRYSVHAKRGAYRRHLERYEDEPAARRRGWLQLWWAQVCRDRARPASLLAGSSSGSKHPPGSSRQGADQRERWSRLEESNPRPRITSAELVAITVRTESIDGRHGSIRAYAGRTGRQIRGRPPRLLFSSELSNPRPERGVRPCAAPGVAPGAARPRPAAPPLEVAPRMAPRMRLRIGMMSLVSVHCKSGGGMPEGPLLDLVGCSRNGHGETLG